MVGRKVYIKQIKCEFPGCSKNFIPYNSKTVYCGDHSRAQIRYSKIVKKLRKPSIVATKDKVFINRELQYERNRLKAIASSPDITNLLVFSPDNGKTLIYCKDGEQLNRAKELFRDIYPRKHSVSQEQ
jgi:hypothetical protein